MKTKAALIRESASLIVLAKNSTCSLKFDYNVLMFNRSEKTSFMPNHAVFPGGAKESVDESALWLKYFKKFGVEDQYLKQLTIVHGPRPDIFKRTETNCIEKEIALRITAIRETFEEVGLFLCRDKGNLNASNNYGAFRENFDRKYWQDQVHNDPTKFLQMCEELNVVPDLWSLYEWSTWITPAAFKKRFQTAFYIVALNEVPSLLAEKTEVVECLWKNPVSFFEAYRDGDVWLPPPQIYELSRLANIYELEKLQKFAAKRNPMGSTEFLPVHRKCNDGLVGILPGDDEYPNKPNECTEFVEIDKTVEEFCFNVKNAHRIISKSLNHAWVTLNFEPLDGHLHPKDMRKLFSKL